MLDSLQTMALIALWDCSVLFFCFSLFQTITSDDSILRHVLAHLPLTFFFLRLVKNLHSRLFELRFLGLFLGACLVRDLFEQVGVFLEQFVVDGLVFDELGELSIGARVEGQQAPHVRLVSVGQLV